MIKKGLKFKLGLGVMLLILLFTAGAAFGEASSMLTFVDTAGGVNPEAASISFTSYYGGDDSKIHTEDSWNDTNNNEGYVSSSGSCRVSPLQMANDQSSASYNIWISYSGTGGNQGGTAAGTVPGSGTGYTTPGTSGSPLVLSTSNYLATPTGFAGYAGNGEAYIKWNQVTGATGYRVYRRPAAGEGATEIVFERASIAASGSITGAVVTGLTNGTTYNFIVVATDSSRRSGHPLEVAVTPTATGVPIITGPDSGTVGSSVIITGSNFGSVTGVVSFNGVAGTVTSWSSTSITATIAAGTPTGAGRVAVINSSSLVGSRSFTVNAPGSPGSLQFSAATYSVAENIASVTITVTRTGGSTGVVGVTYATSNGTATAGSDYTAVTNTLSWADGDSASKTFTVTILNDSVYEGNETVNLALSAPTGGATLGSPSSAILTINDDETPPVAGSLQFSAATYSVAENVATVTINVTRTGGSTGVVGVTYATSNGTAIAGSDYTSTTNTLSWADGDTANKTFNVTIINDTISESSETVNLTLSGPTGGAVLGSPSTATLTITDDDGTTTTPDITGVTPSSPAPGQTIIISGTNLGTSGTITVGGVPITPTRWGSSEIIATIPTGVATGDAIITITTPGGTDTFPITIGGGDTIGSIYIDDFEGGCVGNFTAPAATSGYYVFQNSLDITPGSSEISAQLRQADAAHDGALGAKVRYSYVGTDGSDWGGGWGAILASTRNLSSANYVSFYVNWDGSTNAFKLSLKDTDGTAFAATVTNSILNTSGWHRVVLAKSAFAHDAGGSDPGSNSTFSWEAVTGYNIVYNTTGTSANYHSIDSIIGSVLPPGGETTGESPVINNIVPPAGPAGTRITVNGTKFGNTQGSSHLDFDNATTHVSYQAEIISWNDTVIEAIIPRLATAGTYEVRVTKVSIGAGGTITALQSNATSFVITSGAFGPGIANLKPNPFNPVSTDPLINKVTINADNQGATRVGIYIFDMTARLVYKGDAVVTGTIATATWDGKDMTQVLVGDGAYILRVINEDTKTLLAKGKILVVKR